ALGIVLPHFNQAAQVVPAAHVGAEQAAAQSPCNGGECAAGVAFFIEHLDLDGASGNADHTFQARENLFYDQRFFGRLQFGNVEVNAAAGILERIVIV